MPTEWIAIASDPSGVGDDDRPALDPVGREDRHLRLVDDRRRQEGPERARVRDRERPAHDVVSRQLARAGPVGEVGHRSGEAAERLTVGVVHDRHDEPSLVEVDGNPEVDVAVDDERVVADRGVQLRVVAKRLDHGPGDEGKVGETDALLLAEPVLVGLANLLDALEVGLDHGKACAPRSPSSAPCARR